MWAIVEKERSAGHTSFVYGYVVGFLSLFGGLAWLGASRPTAALRFMGVSTGVLLLIGGVQLVRKKYVGARCFYAAILLAIADQLALAAYFFDLNRAFALSRLAVGLIGGAIFLLANVAYFERRYVMLNA